VRLHTALSEFDPLEWDALAGHQPFVRHAFLNALETSGCATAATGWQPLHMSVHDTCGGQQAVMPWYLKSHSYGEFVFDWAWADAWRRAGLPYYPKLLSAVPFSPVTGPRALGPSGSTATFAAAAEAIVAERELSSAHCLFINEAERDALAAQGWLMRSDCQFHWHNRGWHDFDEFLSSFTAAKRKKVHRERRRVRDAGVSFDIRHGEQLDPPLIDAMHRFYRATFLERGRTPYLNRLFFAELAARLGRALVVIFAIHKGKPIAAAICLRDDHALYGRHWGCEAAYHSLHFETCYYQGIEYCITQEIELFEPGTQGEHKISRGFEPALTWSAHWIRDPDFRAAIDEYLARERLLIDAYAADARRHLPFRKAEN
jgi:predicted N-acyltransferase